MLPPAMMGEGDIAKKGPPHPFGSVCQTIVPSPARGEGKGGDITPRGARSRLELAPWLRVVVSLFALFACVFAAPARTQPAVEDFYKGKQINLIVGYGPGGGYDVVARLLARHLGRYVAGNPNIVMVRSIS